MAQKKHYRDVTVQEAKELLDPHIVAELEKYKKNPSAFAGKDNAPTLKQPEGLRYRPEDTMVGDISIEVELPVLQDATDQSARCTCVQQNCTLSDDGCGLKKPVMKMQQLLSTGSVLEAFLTFGNSSPVFIEQYCAAACEPACVHAATQPEQAVSITFNGAFLDKIGWEFGLHKLLYPKTEISQFTTDKYTKTERPMSVGIVGSGPAGFQLAWEYARAGFEVTVYEQKGDFEGKDYHKNFGGQWRNIPPWKARDDYITEHFKMLEGMGNVRLVHGVEVGSATYPADDFVDDHDIVALAPGVGMSPVELNIKGRYTEKTATEIHTLVADKDQNVVGVATEDLGGEEVVQVETPGVIPALTFLDEMYRDQMRQHARRPVDLSPGQSQESVAMDFGDTDMFLGDKNVVIIAGGDTGEDVKGWVARQVEWARENGREPGEITVLIRQPKQTERSEDVLWPHGFDGLKIGSSGKLFAAYGGEQRHSVSPTEFLIGDDGHVSGVRIDIRELKNPHEARFSKQHRTSWEVVDTVDIPCDLVIEAVGFKTTAKAQTELAREFHVEENGMVDIISTRSPRPGIYVVGDAATEIGANPRHVLHEAMGTAKRAFERAMKDLKEGRMNDHGKWREARKKDARLLHPRVQVERAEQMGDTPTR